MRLAVLILLAVCCGSAWAAASGQGEGVNARALAYETKLDQSFAAVVGGLDRWREQQRRASIDGLTALMANAAGVERTYLAYQLLRLEPANAPARAACDGIAQGAPFDLEGREVAGWSLGGVVDHALAEKVAALIHPPFEIVRDVVAVKSPVVQSYWETQRGELQSLKSDLLAMGDDALVFQMLAYYYPQSKDVVAYYRAKKRRVPTSRWWVDHVDQYLLDHELAGVDCLAWKPAIGPAPAKGADGTSTLGVSTWTFPSCVRGLRVESVLSCPANSSPTFTLTDEHARGVSLTIGKQGITALDLPTRKLIKEVAAPADLASSQTPIDIEIRDKHLRVSVGGLTVIDQEVSSAHAYRRIDVDGRAAPARQLRVRFIGAALPLAPGVAPKPLEKPTAEPWAADRAKDLDQVVSANFSETPAEEVVTFLAKVSGVAVTFDDSGVLLKELPVTLTANSMKLGSVFACLERLTDLKAVPTAAGFTLSWKR